MTPEEDERFRVTLLRSALAVKAMGCMTDTFEVPLSLVKFVRLKCENL